MKIVTSWMEEGRQEGRLQTLREDILDVLEARFGAIPYGIREHVAVVVNEAELKRLHRQAAITPGLEAFSLENSSS